MRTLKQRKRKAGDTEGGDASSKVGKVAKQAPRNENAAVKSKYFKAGSSNPSKVKLKKVATIDGTKKTKGSESESSTKVAASGSERKEVDTADTAGGDQQQKGTKDKAVSNKRLDFKFYDLSCEDLAKALLGQIVVTVYNGKRLAGKIVETEAYLGLVDKAAHSYKGKTERNTAMFMKPGTAYVYNIYGMYCCLNISAQGDGCAVLIRALQPVENLEEMCNLRKKGKGADSLLKKNGKELCNGPSKLCQALGIKKDSVNKVDLCTSDKIWLEKGEVVDPSKIVKGKRININYAEDWIDKPLRFYILGNEFNSVRDKIAEKDLAD